jgi:CspA family cold shock protein
MQGSIVLWKDDGDYGFAKPDVGGPDVFIHRTRLHGFDHLLVGQRVEFDITPNRRTGKPQAFNVKVLNPVLHKSLPPEDDPYTAHMDISQTEFMKRRYD